MTPRRKAELRVLGLFVLVSIVITILGRIFGTDPNNPSAARVVLLVLGFASIAGFIWALFRVERRFPK